MRLTTRTGIGAGLLPLLQTMDEVQRTGRVIAKLRDSDRKLARMLREHLMAAGVDRKEVSSQWDNLTNPPPRSRRSRQPKETLFGTGPGGTGNTYVDGDTQTRPSRTPALHDIGAPLARS